MQSLIVVTSLFLSTPTQITNLSTVQELENDIRASVREITVVLRNRTKIEIKNSFFWDQVLLQRSQIQNRIVLLKWLLNNDVQHIHLIHSRLVSCA